MNKYQKYQKKYKKQHPQYVKRDKVKYYSRGSKSNNYLKWQEDELQAVIDHKMTDVELSELLGRSIASIHTVRSKLKSGKDIPQYIAEMKLKY